ncbi:MAG TPA: aromatic ring-hydroxylating dioxygenase subunit alpha [Chloroflexota bacterium]|nr:aromatic ring-hydroxylating dioxygenase subunit alpha [Chloroflexota bacterium]
MIESLLAGTQAAEARPKTTRGPLYEAAELGFRPYWYPALLSRHLGTKPQAIKMLGENLVFIRAGGRAHALHDQCAHRGMPLSHGTCLTEGTITCAYHGWTYDVSDGRCVAALTDGPESPVPGKKGTGVQSYPVAERNGIIFVYMGSGTPPPLEDDVPDEVLRPDWTIQTVVSVWRGNWRAAVENGYDAGHASYVHRNSLRWRTAMSLQPAWSNVKESQVVGPYLRSGDGKPGKSEEIYPVVGRWPRHSWLRRKLAEFGRKPEHRRPFGNQFHLPCIIHNRYFYYAHIRWAVPVDANTTRNFQVFAGPYQGARAKAFKAHYWLWHRWVFHMMFNGQDEAIISKLDYSAPERLYRPDRSIVDLRKYIETHVRTEDGARPERTADDLAEILG